MNLYISEGDESSTKAGIPGLDFSPGVEATHQDKESYKMHQKKVPFAKPVPKDFELAWTGGGWFEYRRSRVGLQYESFSPVEFCKDVVPTVTLFIQVPAF